ncbi:MAG: hypothetical protein HKN59_05535, partial [Gammaproteobacteria bacterium]|nr:hypothetical protein [Gammaproteobacteria bacterium]
VFSGHYVTGGVTSGYLRQLEQNRSDAAKARRERLLSSLRDEAENQGELFGAA